MMPKPAVANADVDELRARFAHHRVQIRAKSSSRIMRWCARFARLFGNPRFQSHFWTTLGRTIYYPTLVDDPWRHPRVLRHELVHVRQWQRWGLLFWISYLLLPLPVGLAWCRWRWEREAYLEDLAQAANVDMAMEHIVQSLWRNYGWAWPRPWMRRWFRRKLQRNESDYSPRSSRS
ncbi:MAG: hypothetical protein AB8H80_08750 [Planctomycetota bacterium]